MRGLTPAEITDLFLPVADQPSLGLAVSGGADSLALLLLAHEWASGSGAKLFVYSVDHRLRPEAADEAAMVMAVAKKLDIPARTLTWDAVKPDSGVQAAARQARYGLMAKAMRTDGVAILATAHHRNDQAETVLMRMAHGSGLAGLQGMKVFAEIEGVTVFRPLLSVDPAILVETVATAGLVAASDPGNRDTHYERVRWRQALPVLSGFGLAPQVFTDLARRVGEADAALSHYADAAIAEGLRTDALGAQYFAADWYRALPAAIGVRVLAEGLARAGGWRRPFGLGVVERLHQMLHRPDFAGDTGLGCLLRLRDGVIWLVREPARHRIATTFIKPDRTLIWDERFIVINRSEHESFSLAPAIGMARRTAEDLLGFPIMAPAEAIGSAPLLTDGQGAVLGLGLAIRDERVSIAMRVR